MLSMFTEDIKMKLFAFSMLLVEEFRTESKMPFTIFTFSMFSMGCIYRNIVSSPSSKWNALLCQPDYYAL